MNEQVNIEKKLTKSFFKIAAIAAIVSLFTLSALIVISNRYSYALHNYGFAQGDIGKAMFEFADVRSALRAAIGYDDQDVIDKVVKQHNEKKILFEEYFKIVENTIVSEDGRKTYDEIEALLDDYWEIDNRVLTLGASTDRELCKQAQVIAINELADAYNEIYTKLESLLTVKVTEGNQLASFLLATDIIVAIVIVIAIGVSITLSTRFGKHIAKGVSTPLRSLGERLKIFATGELTAPFPQIDTGDEVEYIAKDASEMASNLNVIIHDIDEVLGQMASGNYAVRSKNVDRYTGDFAKLYKSMRGLRDQMTETLLSIGEVSNQVSEGSGDLAKASQGLAEGATEQTNAIMELHTTITNITSTMEKSATNADESYEKAQRYADQADNSREEMNTMMVAMDRINTASTRIGDIISEIESIATQTNLLSLNASIEAARAGESGRGFSVVADQIRVLANQSAKAAVDTRELIEGSIREVTEGNRAAEHAASAIESVVDGIKQIADFSKDLKNMMEEQTDAMRKAENGINMISEVVQSNPATAADAPQTFQMFFAQDDFLNGLIGQFTLRKDI